MDGSVNKSEEIGRMPVEAFGRWPIPVNDVVCRECPEGLSLSRYLLVFPIVALISTLLLARFVEPDQAGYGTHRQLGLAACLSYEKTGMPCPTCGMTTALALLADGDLNNAWRANPALVLLITLWLSLSIWALVVFRCKRLVGFQSWDRPLELWAGGMFAIAMTTWLIRAAQWRLAAGFVLDLTGN
jgi:hypothetical protein